MGKTYLYARNQEIKLTGLYEVDMEDAVKILMKYRDLPFELGVLFGADYSTITRVYGELLPFKEVKSISELFKIIGYGQLFNKADDKI